MLQGLEPGILVRALEPEIVSRFGARNTENTGGGLEPEMLQGLEPGIRGGLWSEKKPQGLEPGILGGVWSEEILQGLEPGIMGVVWSE